ncbi:MAG: hypothetical protein COW00_10680 [Bdellovibrio sp. CG12_big_fil_rev_8_21_14_0_65_39_13]|nr:MAG: hypothetical protein COW78_13695 [Bdellovibrio sp. CG22_combo_CG10-13_8_21_14_all_39_27]PIQ59413.1 MAG: hypothetical protein COW00_10680 [Bdellovibrio sp. CG12_big_fil_rev_8_21_14_0_65_39_13]PIR34931.1 MAG: hypothetical protein COV37_11765 [Bdellovibrio sp. CG11_big_fil_rev_8_21_14_0_20_39_38]PJB52987.1 MAG: hypothetical protein CO099_09660 [Bdellovibrio sp. CG_4_9_14_3_um_filter_39_7]
MKIIELFQTGGFIMYPLLLCSLLVWAVAFEKWRFFKLFTEQYQGIGQKILDLIQDGKFNEAKGLCHGVHPLVARPFQLALNSREKHKNQDSALDRRLLETQLGLKRLLWILGTIGTSAPFIGLFGTVVGIIRSFESIAQTGKSGFAVVAAGIAEALIATASGIIVAVMAVVLYNYFQTRLSHMFQEYRIKVLDILDEL